MYRPQWAFAEWKSGNQIDDYALDVFSNPSHILSGCRISFLLCQLQVVVGPGARQIELSVRSVYAKTRAWRSQRLGQRTEDGKEFVQPEDPK